MCDVSSLRDVAAAVWEVVEVIASSGVLAALLTLLRGHNGSYVAGHVKRQVPDTRKIAWDSTKNTGGRGSGGRYVVDIS